MGVITSMCCQAQGKQRFNRENIGFYDQKSTLCTQGKKRNQKEILKCEYSTFDDLSQPKGLRPLGQLTDSRNNISHQEDHHSSLPSQTSIKLSSGHRSQINNRKEASINNISQKDFTVRYKLGCGTFGQVFLAEFKENSLRDKAYKGVIKRIQVMQPNLPEQIRLQQRILLESQSKFITKLHYSFRDKKYYYMVMQWAQGGDTFTLIRKKQANSRLPNPRFLLYKQVGQEALRFILGSVVLGLQYLQSKNIIYRDLKPENILIFSDGYVKLADFGLAKQLKQKEKTRSYVGTPVYYAPEVILRTPYGKEADLWSLGVYAYEMSNYELPFSCKDLRIRHKVQFVVKKAENNRIWKNNALSSELKNFIDSLLKFDPRKRLGANGFHQIKNHSFFTSSSFDWQSLEKGQIQSPLKKIIESTQLKLTPFQQTKIGEQLKDKQKDLLGQQSYQSDQFNIF